MGAKTWMLVYADGNVYERLAALPSLDRDASATLAAELFPDDRLAPLEDGDLYYTCPPDDEIHVGCYPGVSIIAASEFAIDYPSKLLPRFLNATDLPNVYLHAMHSVVDWFAFAVWRSGKLERSLSVSPEYGVMEDIGPRMPFELPYWSGMYPAIDPDDEPKGDDAYPFPFHPLELEEAALLALFGYQIEGYIDSSFFDPESVPLVRFKRKKASRFKFW